MDKRTNIASRMSACVLIFINLVVMVSCTTLFIVGIWMIASPTTLSSAINATQIATLKALVADGGVSVHLGVTSASVAMFAFSISLMGVYGAVTRSPFQLFMYSILVFLLMLLECALIFYYSTSVTERGVQQNGEWAHTTRILFSCCEHNSSFTESNPHPWSCCGTDVGGDCTPQRAYKKDCQTSVIHWLDRYQTSIYVTVVVFHLVLSFCSLIRRSTASRSDT